MAWVYILIRPRGKGGVKLREKRGKTPLPPQKKSVGVDCLVFEVT